MKMTRPSWTLFKGKNSNSVLIANIGLRGQKGVTICLADAEGSSAMFVEEFIEIVFAMLNIIRGEQNRKGKEQFKGSK